MWLTMLEFPRQCPLSATAAMRNTTAYHRGPQPRRSSGAGQVDTGLKEDFEDIVPAGLSETVDPSNARKLDLDMLPLQMQLPARPVSPRRWIEVEQILLNRKSATRPSGWKSAEPMRINAPSPACD